MQQAIIEDEPLARPHDVEVRVIAAPHSATWMRLIGDLFAQPTAIKRDQGAAQDIAPANAQRIVTRHGGRI